MKGNGLLEEVMMYGVLHVSFVNDLMSVMELVCSRCKCSYVYSSIIQLTENCKELYIIHKLNCLNESPLKKKKE